MLECQVPLKDFCKALYFRCPYILKNVRIRYIFLIKRSILLDYYRGEMCIGFSMILLRSTGVYN